MRLCFKCTSSLLRATVHGDDQGGRQTLAVILNDSFSGYNFINTFAVTSCCIQLVSAKNINVDLHGTADLEGVLCANKILRKINHYNQIIFSKKKKRREREFEVRKLF